MVVADVAGPSWSERAASTSWWRKRVEWATSPTRMASEAAEHFCPACPKAEWARSAAAWSMSASGMTTMAFLPEVSAKRGVRGARRANSSAVSKDPVSTTAPSPPCPIRREPTGPSAQRTPTSASAGMPAVRQAATAAKAMAGVWGTGFTMAALPAASAASAPPIGMASGKFQGPATATTPRGRATAPSRRSSRRARPA